MLSVLLLLLSVVTDLPTRAYSFRENGVDVSAWQGNVDWQLLAGNNNMRFTILRACKLPDPSDTAEKTHDFFKDANFDYNYTQARAVGLKVGCYCRMAAGSYTELISTTQKYIDVIAGKDFDLPVYIDAEDNAMAAIAKAQGKAILTSYLLEAMDMIAAAGHHPGLYANLNWFSNYVDASMVRAKGYDLWLARYTHDCDSTDFSTQYDAWQYSNKGHYAGVQSSDIDLDVSYKNYQYAGDHGWVIDTRYAGTIPCYVYSNRDIVPCYSDFTTAINGQVVSSSSQCYIQEAYTNGWCRVLYDSFGGSRVGYLPLDAFAAEVPTTEPPTEPPTTEPPTTQPPTEPPTEAPKATLEQDSMWNGLLPIRANTVETGLQPIYEADCETMTGEAITENAACKIVAAFTNGWCCVEYSSSEGEGSGYLPLSAFFKKERKGFGQLYASEALTTYLFGSTNYASDSVDAGSLIVYTGENEEMIQVIYAKNGERRLEWISKREWYLVLLKILNAHIHGKQPLLERQVPLMDCDGDGTIDCFDLALMKYRIDILP